MVEAVGEPIRNSRGTVPQKSSRRVGAVDCHRGGALSPGTGRACGTASGSCRVRPGRLSGDGQTDMPLAQRGDPHAQALLGFMYQYGKGIPQSYDMAVRWYIQAAEGGDANGQYLLGLMYDKGLGVGQDIVLAYKWLNLCAAANAPGARANNLPGCGYQWPPRDMTRTQIDLAQRLSVDFVPRY